MSEDGRLAPVEGIAEDTAAGFRAQVAQAARDRAGSWDAVADVLAAPGPELVERLRAGELATVWRLGARWLGADAELFTRDLMSLDVYARGSRRRSADDDLAALRADHDRSVAAEGDLVSPVRRVADLCREEADAWAAGDMAAGRAVRARERTLIEDTLVPGLPNAGGRLAQEAEARVSSTLGRLVLAVLSVESGRDYLRAVLGDEG
ncbi:hypothetical protein KZX45_19190 [Georgenia sp. EYE_87]|uniref:hypothetical protein n=1 Tax=Georgenia sp. EYE_87 TaxID=2853448 RepID=UPI002004F3C0|nr:hypothetical protein [Georgenia sp. EYE_87]MCK6212668.1 hypothetical protein [Georgenia sp. EYE_87]